MDQYYPHLQSLKEKKAEILSYVQKWSNIHSGSLNISGLKEMEKHLQEDFLSLHAQCDAIPLCEKSNLTIDGTIEKTPLGKALLWNKHPNAAIQLLLVGHMDIAYPTESPLSTCQIVRKKFLQGRGAADMKGGLAILLYSLKALENSPFAGKLGWRILITPDEEIGSPSSRELLIQEAKKCHLGLIFEPAFPDGSLAGSRMGSLNYTFCAIGKSSHVGREFYLGKNAISSVTRFVSAAESLTDQKENITVNIGYIQGGGPVNIVPGNALCKLNIRVNNINAMNLVQEKLAKIAEKENNREQIHAILHLDSERPPKLFDKDTKRLFISLKRSAQQLNIPLIWQSTGGVCDGNTLASAGLRTIDTLGPIGGKLHTDEEYLIVDSLLERTLLVARFLMQIATGQITIPCS